MEPGLQARIEDDVTKARTINAPVIPDHIALTIAPGLPAATYCSLNEHNTKPGEVFEPTDEVDEMCDVALTRLADADAIRAWCSEKFRDRLGDLSTGSRDDDPAIKRGPEISAIIPDNTGPTGSGRK